MTTAPVVKRHVFVPEFDADPNRCHECFAQRDAEQHLAAVELDNALVIWLEELNLVDDSLAVLKTKLLAPLEERREHAVRNLQSAMGDAEAATVNGRPVVTWVWSKPADGIDLAALKRDHPDIYEAYAKPKKAARPFKPVVT